MALTFTGTGGLFTRLGKLGKLLRLANTQQNTVLDPTQMPAAIAGQYASTLTSIPATILNNTQSYIAGAEVMGGDIRTAAQNTVQQMVFADTPSQAGSLASSLANVVYQMQQQAYYVNPVTVAASSAVYPSSGSNTGDGQIVLTTKRGDGLIQQHIVAEVDPIVCTADAQTGGATSGQETFTFAGSVDEGDPFSYLWPTGSNGSSTLSAVPASVNYTGSGTGAGNILNNGNFDTFTAGVPNQWTVDAGVTGTDYQAGGSAASYQGSNCLEILGGGSVLQSFTQQFNLAGGSLATLKPLTTYIVSFWAKYNSSPAAGVIKFELVGGTTYAGSSIQNDAQSVANSTQFTVSSGFTSSWAPYSVVFRTPRVLPASISFRIVVTTLISSGTNLFIDNVAMTQGSALYPGGPTAAIFSGVTPFIAGDGWYATMTNNRDGATYMSTFSALFDRLFGMRQLGLILPYITTTTNIPDTLITA